MERQRHFTMLRELRLADVFTLANGFAGMGAVLSTLQYLATGDRDHLRFAFLLLPVALVFDFADGRIARWRQKVSPLGQELDSLADLISFGVAPAALGFAMGLRGGWDAVVFLYFVGCGISRLARYNVTAGTLSDSAGKVRYFEGTPIPTSLAIVAWLGVLFALGREGDLPFGEVHLGPWLLHPMVLVYTLSGSAMISKTLRIPKP